MTEAVHPVGQWRWRLAVAFTGLWWASLVLLGALVVPLLFQHLPTPSMAGQMAARLFAAQTWVSVACAMAVLLILTRRSGEMGESGGSSLPARTIGVSMAAVGGLLCALLIEFAVAPRILAGQNMRLWHGLGTALFALQGGLAVVAWWFCLGLAPAKPSPAD